MTRLELMHAMADRLLILNAQEEESVEEIAIFHAVCGIAQADGMLDAAVYEIASTPEIVEHIFDNYAQCDEL